MNPAPESIRSATSWIGDWLPVRDKIVLALTSTADRLTGRTRKKLRRLADEIAFAKRESDILKNPLALEIFLVLAGKQEAPTMTVVPSTSTTVSGESDVIAPILSNDTGAVDCLDDDLNVSVEHAVNGVLLNHLPVQVARQQMLTMMAYPLLVLLVCGIIFFLTSTLLIPTFESMFQEFGLTLPLMTKLLFAVAGLVSSPWTYLCLGLILLCQGVYFYMQRAPSWRRPHDPAGNSSGVNLRGTGVRSKRGVCGDWAWHISLLMRAGLGKADAIELAGDSSRRDWLRRDSRVWAQELRAGQNPFLGITDIRGVSCPLLTDILAVDRNSETQSSRKSTGDIVPLDQAGVLRDVAEIYWDRAQPQSVSHLGCLYVMFYLGVLLTVGFVVLSLFAPLVQLITGLT